MSIAFAKVDAADPRFAAAWTAHVASSAPGCRLEHIEVAMRCEADKEHHFVLGLDESGRAVFVAYLVAESVSLALGLTLRLLMLGGTLTTGRAMWVDVERVAYETAIRALMRFCSDEIPFSLLMLKPFERERDLGMLQCNSEKLDFINIFGSVRGDLDLTGIRSFDDYLASLDGKKRYWLRKVEKDAAQAGLVIELKDEFAQDVPDIYPLYLSVHERAKEIKSPDAAPLRYFEHLARSRPLAAKLLAVRAHGRLIGFCVLLEQPDFLECGVCGMDHQVAKDYNTWYVFMLNAIKHAIASGKRGVLLGTTNYAMKRKFGALRSDSWISIRFQSPLVTRILEPLIRLKFKGIFAGAEAAEQPAGTEAAA